MHHRQVIALLLLCSAFTQASSTPNSATCALTDEQFLAATNTLRDWPAIHSFYKTHFPQCPNDGFYAAGYSEVVVRTLATSWHQIDELAAATHGSSRFKKFVLRHITASTEEADLRVILANATSDCSKANAALCLQIRRAAGKAVKEVK